MRTFIGLTMFSNDGKYYAIIRNELKIWRNIRGVYLINYEEMQINGSSFEFKAWKATQKCPFPIFLERWDWK